MHSITVGGVTGSGDVSTYSWPSATDGCTLVPSCTVRHGMRCGSVVRKGISFWGKVVEELTVGVWETITKEKFDMWCISCHLLLECVSRNKQENAMEKSDQKEEDMTANERECLGLWWYEEYTVKNVIVTQYDCTVHVWQCRQHMGLMVLTAEQ